MYELKNKKTNEQIQLKYEIKKIKNKYYVACEDLEIANLVSVRQSKVKGFLTLKNYIENHTQYNYKDLMVVNKCITVN